MTVFRTITAAAKAATLDDAAFMIQEALGQEDGGVACQFFGDKHVLAWPNMSHVDRYYLICRYVMSEINMLVAE